MQHRYTGDIGDYAKYGLIRWLAPGYHLGVSWYLYPDELHNGDGRHISYLDVPEKWRHLDPVLFDALKGIVLSGQRDLQLIERSGLLGDAVFSGAVQNFAGKPADRAESRVEWFRDVLRDLSGCDLIFADPDNGVCEDSKYAPSRHQHWKRMPLSEVQSLTKGRVGIIYHHNSRFAGGHAKEIQFWLSRLGPETLALYWRPFSPRSFFIVNPTREIKERVTDFVERWSPHFLLHTFNGEEMTALPRPAGVHLDSTPGAMGQKSCPVCGHRFKGTGWGGIDAHWKSQHEHLMPYREAWPLIKKEQWQRP